MLQGMVHPDAQAMLLPLEQLTKTMLVFRSLPWYFPPSFIVKRFFILYCDVINLVYSQAHK